jgi:hypothetical protein
MKPIAFLYVLVALPMAAAPIALAAEDAPPIRMAQAGPSDGSGQTIYGSQMMTQQERMEYRQRMRNAKSAEERLQIRQQHHEEMKVRAKERGITLPDEPPANRGPGMGGGMGGGMGPGGGMGGGGGRGR